MGNAKVEGSSPSSPLQTSAVRINWSHSQLSSNQIARARTPPLTRRSKREQFRAVPLR